MFHKTQRILAVVGATGAVVAAAPAANAMTVRVGDPTLIDRVAISVPLAVSCTPFDPAYTYVSDGVSVSVQQASGRDIAFGSGYLSGGVYGMGQPSLLFACDGTEQTVTVPVSANTAGPPFHGGPAVINASANAAAAQPCYPGATNCYTNFISQTASTGAVEVRL